MLIPYNDKTVISFYSMITRIWGEFIPVMLQMSFALSWFTTVSYLTLN